MYKVRVGIWVRVRVTLSRVRVEVSNVRIK